MVDKESIAALKRNEKVPYFWVNNRDIKAPLILTFPKKGARDVEFFPEHDKWQIKGVHGESRGNIFDFLQWFSVYGTDGKDLPN